MTYDRRVLHTSETYMSTGEMEMTVALLFCDDRYDDEVSVVPFSYLGAISKAAAVHSKFEKACLEIQQLEDVRKESKDAAIRSKVGKLGNDNYFAGVLVGRDS